MIWMWKYVDDMIGKGLELSVILEMMWYAALWHVPMCLPLSILLSSIMAFGKLGETNELTSLKSLGISLQKTMFSLIVFNAMLSVGAFFFSNNVLPLTAFKMHSLLNDIVQKKQFPKTPALGKTLEAPTAPIVSHRPPDLQAEWHSWRHEVGDHGETIDLKKIRPQQKEVRQEGHIVNLKKPL